MGLPCSSYSNSYFTINQGNRLAKKDQIRQKKKVELNSKGSCRSTGSYHTVSTAREFLFSTAHTDKTRYIHTAVLANWHLSHQPKHWSLFKWSLNTVGTRPESMQVSSASLKTMGRLIYTTESWPFAFFNPIGAICRFFELFSNPAKLLDFQRWWALSP